MRRFCVLQVVAVLTSGMMPAASGDAATVEMGFEECAPGPFQKLVTASGTWERVSGIAAIDTQHARSGRQCLHLSGGRQTVVTLDLPQGTDTSGELTFYAERWTRREPFRFRIEKEAAAGWIEIYNGDKAVRVGRGFLSRVAVPLRDRGIRRLRLTVTSPPSTGILIDDLRIAPATKQKIVSVQLQPLTLPVLIGGRPSPVARLRVETTGDLQPIALSQLTVALEGTTSPADVRSISLHHTAGASARFSDARQLAAAPVRAAAGEPIVLACDENAGRLSAGTNDIWVAVQVGAAASLSHRVGVACRRAVFSDRNSQDLEGKAAARRLGIAVRNGGDDGVHTYRIPGLATTTRGSLIAVYDVRHRGSGDLPGDIDVGMSRSTDGGQTWAAMKIIMDMGSDPKWRYDGIGDPAILVDQVTGTIWVAATWSHGNRSWVGSGPGMSPEETGQLMLVSSSDDGLTWSKPINITEQVKQPEWCFLLAGPGKGITMRDGTLVFAAQYQDSAEQGRLPHSMILWSKDHGRTWHAGTGAFDDTTEAQVVEVEPGVLMLNCRFNGGPVRVVMTTRDLGRTWERHPTSQRALIEPRACMASLIDVDRELGRDTFGWLLFSNPDSRSVRQRIMIKGSRDRGLTWPAAHRVLLDELPGRGYSCMSMIDAQTVGILYESSQADLVFQRVPLKDVIDADGDAPAAGQKQPEPRSTRLSLPGVFGSHMVLQADRPIPIRGRAPAGTKVTVTFGSESREVLADESGEWQLRLESRPATFVPATMTVRGGGETIRFTDVLVGEVWVCAGQSNMQWPLRQSAHGEQELSSASRPGLRLLMLSPAASGTAGSFTPTQLDRLTPDRFFDGAWVQSSPESAAPSSAVAWYFGTMLQDKLQTPVGLICAAVGGTPTEAWLPARALRSDVEFAGYVTGNWLDNPRLGAFCRQRGEQNLLAAIQSGLRVPADSLGPSHSFKPEFLWSAAIERLSPFGIRGAIWYQGESNAESLRRVREHGELLPRMIESWRQTWGQGDFPFLMVQLPAMDRPLWPWFRETQRRVSNRVPNTGLAVTIDTGDPDNVHPPLKKPVGQRLAQLALARTYAIVPREVTECPQPSESRREDAAIVVSWKPVGAGLRSSDGQPLRHFEICSADGVFHPAEARLLDGATIRVSSRLVRDPVFVRYAWLPFPEPPVNLVSAAGLPASPFSTESDDRLFGVIADEAGRQP